MSEPMSLADATHQLIRFKINPINISFNIRLLFATYFLSLFISLHRIESTYYNDIIYFTLQFIRIDLAAFKFECDAFSEGESETESRASLMNPLLLMGFIVEAKIF